MKSRTFIAVLAVAAMAAGAYKAGWLPTPSPAEAPVAVDKALLTPAVSVVRVKPREFVETVLVTGSLIAREEILVAPEVEGLRVLELKAEEGDRVKKGDVLAVLVSEQLQMQIAQRDAAAASADAVISQTRSQIAEAEAKLVEAKAALERARPLVQSKYLSESVFDQRDSAAKAAEAQLTSAKDGLKVAEAQRALVEAQRDELRWRHGKTEIRAPADGIISRRSVRVGSIAVGAFVAGGGESLFRIIANGEIELDAEVPETDLSKVAPGQHAVVDVAGNAPADGEVRLVLPEVDKATRLGRVRIFLGDRPELKIGAFARGKIQTSQTAGLAVPQSAVLYGDQGATVQVVVDGMVSTRPITIGLTSGGIVEARSGLKDGEVIVAKAGTFLREGDAVRPVEAAAEVSEAGP